MSTKATMAITDMQTQPFQIQGGALNIFHMLFSDSEAKKTGITISRYKPPNMYKYDWQNLLRGHVHTIHRIRMTLKQILKCWF